MSRTGGFALLEVLLALTILAVTGLMIAASARVALDAERHSEAEEQRVSSASRVLAASTLLTKPQLDQRVGEHRVGEFSVRIQRPEPSLYRIAVADTGIGRELVVTIVRP